MSDIDFKFENDELHFRVDGNLGLITFKKAAFAGLANLETTGKILDIFDWLEQDPIIRGILVFNTKDAFADDSYEAFLKELIGDKNNKDINRTLLGEKRIIRARQINSLNNFIRKIINLRKLVFFCLQGRVVTPYFGACLSSDFRFVSDSLVFSLAHIKYGVHPIGALPFFLGKFLNESKAMKILINCADIKKNEALNLGLVDMIFPEDEFHDACIEEAQKLIQIDDEVLRLTKRLTYHFQDELENYFNLEAKLIGL